PSSATTWVEVPHGVDLWSPDRPHGAGQHESWGHLPEHLSSGGSLGHSCTVHEVTGFDQVCDHALRVIKELVPEFAPYAHRTGAPTGSVPDLVTAFSPTHAHSSVGEAFSGAFSKPVRRPPPVGPELRQFRLRA